MNIAIIHPFLNGRGGSQRYVLEIYKQLKKNNDLKITLYSFELNPQKCYPELLEKITIHSYKIIDDIRDNPVSKQENNTIRIYFKNIFKYSKVKSLFNYFGLDYLYSLYITIVKTLVFYKYLSKKIVKQDYDIIFCHEEPLSIYTSILLSKIQKIPLVWFCYDTIEKWYIDWSKHKHLKFRKLILKNIFFKFDQLFIKFGTNVIFVLDSRMKQRVFNLYGKTAEIIRGGMSDHIITDIQSKNRMRKKYLEKRLLGTSSINIGLVTRFAPSRRIEDLFFLIRKINNSSLRNKFQFKLNSPVTDVEYFSKLKNDFSDIFSSNLIEIDTKPFPSDSELLFFYLNTDIFIFPNSDQTWGHAALEAMTYGCYTIVSDGCGISEIMQTQFKSVYKCGDIDELLEIIINLNNIDVLNYGMIQQKNVIDNFNWGSICSIYLKRFNQLVQPKR